MSMKVKFAFTLIETLLTIAIIGLLLALLLPAVQAARESARRGYCQNNLKQIGIASTLHHDSQRAFPTGGWGNRWIGDPNSGFSIDQPGGWVFNILDYIEKSDLRNCGKELGVSQRQQALGRMMAVPIGLFACPSRREISVYPFANSLSPINALAVPLAAKSDYAVNGGSNKIVGGSGPLGASPTAILAYRWPDTRLANGICYVRSRVRMYEVVDGLTNTYLAGEKYINMESPDGNGGDDQTMYLGDDADVRRWGFSPPLSDKARIPTRDTFGSRHVNICFFLTLDGSVRAVSFGIDSMTHERLSDRADGQIVFSSD